MTSHPQRFVILSLVLFSVFIFCSCSTLGKSTLSSTNKKEYNIPENCDFMALISSNNFSNACSPILLVHAQSIFEGIVINGPEKVVWQKKDLNSITAASPSGQTSGPLRLMITGLVQAKYMYLSLEGAFSDSVLLVAVNNNTSTVYSGGMSKGDMHWIPKPLMTPEQQLEHEAYNEAQKDALIEDHFTLDLVYDLGLPIEDAT